MKQRYGVGRCCCVCDPIGTDDFDRADSGDLGSDWTEVSGGANVEIASNKLAFSDAALVRFDTSHPDSSAKCYVSAKVTMNDDLDKMRVIVAYTDSNNYLAVEVENDSNTVDRGDMRVIERNAGVETTLNEHLRVLDFHENETEIFACYDGQILSGGIVGSGTLLSGVPSVAYSGTHVGLEGKVVSTDCTFDDFKYLKHADDEAGCPSCEVRDCDACDSGLAPTAIEVNLGSIADDACTSCANLSGFFVCDFAGKLSDLSGQRCIYQYEFSPSECFGVIGAIIVEIVHDSGLNTSELRVSLAKNLWEPNGLAPEAVQNLCVTFKDDGVSGTYDCDGFSSESLSNITDHGNCTEASPPFDDLCDYSSATCTITAIV